MKKIKAIALSLLCLFLVSLGLPLEGEAKIPDRKTVHYVALGDSLAAGKLPYDSEINGKGYPDYLAERFEQSNYQLTYENYGVNGFTTNHVINLLENNDKTVTAIKKADIMTINIGANDLLGVLLSDDFDQLTYGEKVEALAAASHDAVGNLDSILESIEKIDPQVDVYVMGYYNALEPLKMEENFKRAVTPLLHQFNDGIKEVAETYGAEYVPTFTVIAKDYETYLPEPDVHLSEEGYQVVAKEFWKKITPRKFGE